MWTLTGFADEVATDFAAQLELMATLGITFIELRSAWGVRVLDLDDSQVDRAKAMLGDAGIAVSALGTDLGKIGILDDFDPHLDRTRRAIEVAHRLGTTDLRGFSFFIPPDVPPLDHRAEVIDRLGQMVQLAADAGVRYLHENEKAIYGETPQRCEDLADQFDDRWFGLILDPANYVQCGILPVDEAYPIVARATRYVHVKDAVLADATVRPAGEGDAQWPQLIEALHADGYDGFLSLEPHLGVHDTFGGLSGAKAWTAAHTALIELLRSAHIPWA